MGPGICKGCGKKLRGYGSRRQRCAACVRELRRLAQLRRRAARRVAKVPIRCAQCGEAFQPQRTTARFCSPKCRVYWHREKGCYAK
jgi:hypothetical protein